MLYRFPLWIGILFILGVICKFLDIFTTAFVLDSLCLGLHCEMNPVMHYCMSGIGLIPSLFFCYFLATGAGLVALYVARHSQPYLKIVSIVFFGMHLFVASNNIIQIILAI